MACVEPRLRDHVNARAHRVERLRGCIGRSAQVTHGELLRAKRIHERAFMRFTALTQHRGEWIHPLRTRQQPHRGREIKTGSMTTREKARQIRRRERQNAGVELHRRSASIRHR